MARVRSLVTGIGVAAVVGALSPAAAMADDPPPAAPAPPSLPAPSLKGGSYIARLVTAAVARSEAGHGHVVAHVASSTDWVHESMELMVLGSATVDGQEWLQVRLPNRPNQSSGWISADRAQVSRTSYWITVQTRRRVVRVYHNGKLVHRYPAVIGKATTPTPHGLYSVYERNPLSGNGFLGSMALPLTAFSPTLRHFGGGPGRVAIHGRGGASLSDKLGSAASHGCIRINNGPVDWIANHAPLGTPVEITD
jgi:lipoprotein-anchoring transpeptidase ErfK/SrfK